jgi:hypothetical protein
MSDHAALTDLLEKVEAGWPPDIDTPYMSPFYAAFGQGWIARDAWEANQGSLDAAKTLHEAVLPDHSAMLFMGDGEHIANVKPRVSSIWGDGARSKVPARAWLIAIIRALIAAIIRALTVQDDAP